MASQPLVGAQNFPTKTVESMVEDCLNLYLHGQQRGTLNRLENAVGPVTAITNRTETIDLEWAPHAAKVGSYLSINNELMLVVEVAGQRLTVLRCQMGSTANGLTYPAESLVEIDPRFPRSLIYQTLWTEILSWPSALYAAVSGDVVVGAHDWQAEVDFTGLTTAGVSGDTIQYHRRPTVLGLLRCERKPYDSHDRWTKVAHPTLRYDHDTDDFTSGIALHFGQTFGRETTLRVTLAVPLGIEVFDTYDLSHRVMGMLDSQTDIPPLGCAIRMLRSKEIQRTSTVGGAQPRRAEDVPAGFITKTADSLQQLYDRRMSEEIERLYGRWGVMIS